MSAIEREFVGAATAPSDARLFARQALLDLVGHDVAGGMLGGDVELIVSELVTNSVRAASPIVHVALSLSEAKLLVSVGDEAAGWPEQREAGIHDTGGRGLPLVSAISSSWGVRMLETGKTVWAELDVPD
ncbi:ATP-binding protein [uncultured Jatrophihabitans sp.]|uniref:ATP-binding protein n=1 Tax=uncultured Jatrophihabitans sp. TaxID=1610747 RepID=UPI0035CC9537